LVYEDVQWKNQLPITVGNICSCLAQNLAEEWRGLDLIIITNQVYGKHDIEYIVPEPYYSGKSAKIINLGAENF
jgi:hypothetical protein